MTTPCRVAVDVGTSGGTAVAGRVEGGRLVTEAVHRFDPGRTTEDGRAVWDLDHLVGEAVAGLDAAERAVGPVASVGFDATAGDFGFVKDGAAVRNPVREGGRFPESVPRREAFDVLGHARLPGAYYARYREDPALVEDADWLLPLPALLAAELGAEPHAEVSYAVCAGLASSRTRAWATDLLERVGLPTDVLPPMGPIGAEVGAVDPSFGRAGGPTVVAAPGHDTSAAVAAVPFEGAPRAFLATGSWFIPGFELPEAVVTDEAFAIPAENMAGVDGTARFVRNVPGFSLLEGCREQWRARGGVYEYEALIERAAAAEPGGPLVDTTASPLRGGHGGDDVLGRIERFCRTTDQRVPRGEGEVTRCLLESLAAKSALLLDRLADAASVPSPDRLHLVGGGARNPLLRRLLASATGTPVVAGPVEATAVGNLLVQLRTAGAVDSIAAGRELVGRSVDLDRTEPAAPDRWAGILDRMRAVEAAAGD